MAAISNVVLPTHALLWKSIILPSATVYNRSFVTKHKFESSNETKNKLKQTLANDFIAKPSLGSLCGVRNIQPSEKSTMESPNVAYDLIPCYKAASERSHNSSTSYLRAGSQNMLLSLNTSQLLHSNCVLHRHQFINGIQSSSHGLHTSCRRSEIYVIDTEEDFESKVMRSSLPVVVNFHADWCEPCHALRPLLEGLANQFQGKMHLAEVMTLYLTLLRKTLCLSRFSLIMIIYLPAHPCIGNMFHKI